MYGPYQCKVPEQIWQITVNNLSNNFQIDTEIFMNQKVAEILDILPGNFGGTLA